MSKQNGLHIAGAQAPEPATITRDGDYLRVNTATGPAYFPLDVKPIIFQNPQPGGVGSAFFAGGCLSLVSLAPAECYAAYRRAVSGEATTCKG